jgi:DNA polymerase
MPTQLDLFDDGNNRIMASPTYATFRRRLLDSGCNRCPLHAQRTHIVPDRGNPDTRLMAIGEGPGEQEDLQGLAFVGRAGQLLDKIMAAIDLDTNRDMIICNIVKCRPPANRTPRQEEAKACMPYLKRQIELVAPAAVLLLGATAFKHIIRRKDNFVMEQEAGRFFTDAEYPGIQFMVLYHPAYILRDPRKKPVMWEHVKRLRAFLDTGKTNA